MKRTDEMTDVEFRLFRGLVYDASGIWLRDDKKDYLERRVARRLSSAGAGSFYQYYKLLADGSTGDSELAGLIDSLTVNETSFFRNRPQIDLFKDVVVPRIIESRRSVASNEIRVWSAGCSTGQEPYTIAMTLCEAISDIGSWRITISATDINTVVLDFAAKGVYSADRMDGVDDARLQAFFKKTRDGYEARDGIRRLVAFSYHNLATASREKSFDVVFCRNVLIYFDEAMKKRVLKTLIDSLVPGGYLFLGHSETLQGVGSVEFIHHNKGTAYRKRA